MVKESDSLPGQNLDDKKIKKCKFCPSTFKTPEEYLGHIETAHQDKRKHSFMCNMCGKQYKSKNELTHHMNSKCGTIKQFKCKICGQELMSAGSLYNHMLRHNGEKSFMCRFCAKFFYTAGQLKVHERIHTQDKAYVCEVCNKGFCHRQSLITHSSLHTGIKPYLCEGCGESFSCVGNLIKHRRSKPHAKTCGTIPLTTHRVKHPSTKIKVKINTPANSRLKNKEKCDEVKKEVENLKTELTKNKGSSESEENEDEYEVEENFKLSDSRDLTDGKVTVGKAETSENYKNLKLKITNSNKETKNLEKEKFPTECRYCGRQYLNYYWFKKHLKEHECNNDSEDLHKCSCCTLTFSTRQETLVHQQAVHADILYCKECDKMFANRDSIRAHQRIFHKGGNRKIYSYICGKCGKQFKQKSYLMVHESRNCDKGPSFECTICNKQYSSIYTRNNHMKMHDSEKKLLCKYCAKSFHWRGQLKIHERSHTGEKPFACLYCPKAFAYRESLLTHSTLHTGIKPHLCESCGSRFSCIGNLVKHRRNHASECGPWPYKNQKT